MRSHWVRRKGFRGRSRRRWGDPRAASDNVTHGSWIIVAVGVGALLMGILAIPGGPVHHWLECNILEIPNIGSQQSGPLVCQIPNGDSPGPQVTSVFSSTGSTITATTVFTVLGSNLPIYAPSSVGATPSTTTGGDTFPNFLLQFGGDPTAVGNPQSAANDPQVGNNSATLGNSAAAAGITVLNSSSTSMQFQADLGSRSLSTPVDLWVADHPIALGALANAGSGTSSPYAGTPVPGALLDQWDPAQTGASAQYSDQSIGANTVLASTSGGTQSAESLGFTATGGGSSSLNPAIHLPLQFGQSPNWTYDYLTTYDYVAGGPMTFNPGDETVYTEGDTEYAAGYITSGTVPTNWSGIMMTATVTLGPSSNAGNPTLAIHGTFTAMTPTYTRNAVNGSGGPNTFGGRTIPIIFAPVAVTVYNSTGGEVASATLVEANGSLGGSVTLPAQTRGTIAVTIQTPVQDLINGVGVNTTQLLTIPAS